jgi:hypothetical protein
MLCLKSQETLPHESVWHYCDSPKDGGVKVQFRLLYRGSLPSDSSRRDDAHRVRMVEVKSRIRAYLHPQIRDFWQSHPALSVPGGVFAAKYTERSLSFWDYYADQYKVVSASNHIHKFAPLITAKDYNGCAVNVLFLRRDMPNTPLIHQGDLDNRIKVLFDALKVPKGNELVDEPQPLDQRPCFCLVEDDRYIDHVSVTTDRLLAPLGATESIDDVLILMHIIARVVDSERHFSPM